MAKLLLFDLDGTLLLTHGAGMRAMTRAAAGLLGDHYSFDGVTIGGGLDPWLYHEAARLRGIDNAAEHHETFREIYARELAAELARDDPPSRVLPGVLDLLAHLRRRDDVVLGLLTGNYAHTGPIKLRHVGIEPDWFAVHAWGDEAPDRPALIPLARDRCRAVAGHAPQGSDVIVIGDTPRDIDCAHRHGCVAFAVATGPHSTLELTEAGAEHVVEDLSDPAPLLSLLA